MWITCVENNREYLSGQKLCSCELLVDRDSEKNRSVKSTEHPEIQSYKLACGSLHSYPHSFLKSVKATSLHQIRNRTATPPPGRGNPPQLAPNMFSQAAWGRTHHLYFVVRTLLSSTLRELFFQLDLTTYLPCRIDSNSIRHVGLPSEHLITSTYIMTDNGC